MPFGMQMEQNTATKGRSRKRNSHEGELLSQHIHQVLTEDITSGVLRPGEVLDETAIAQRFNASRTPVREALRQLGASGLVEIRPRRGVIVSRLTAERLSDMFEATAEIEATCVRLASYRISAIERAKLQALYDESAALVTSGQVEQYRDFNRRFHELIYEATHNQFLIDQALSVRARLQVFRNAQLRYEGRLARSNAEHGEILRAMARGDGEEAARCMRAHMVNAGSVLVSHLTE